MPDPIKTVFVGPGGCGKTSLLNYWVGNEFSYKVKSTIGARLVPKAFKSSDGTTSTFNCWDTAGKDNYISLAPLYFRDAQIIVLAYDVSREDGFSLARAYWDRTGVLEHIQQNPQVSVMLVACKSDINSGSCINQADAFAKESKYRHVFTSAKSGFSLGSGEPFEQTLSDLSRSLPDTSGKTPQSKTGYMRLEEEEDERPEISPDPGVFAKQNIPQWFNGNIKRKHVENGDVANLIALRQKLTEGLLTVGHIANNFPFYLRPVCDFAHGLEQQLGDLSTLPKQERYELELQL